ncbi:AMP-binding protein [Lentilitoribacter sp. EG35]|uniref:AMP-binding protein n=1 Tax=Lentilitoribacter sp. EG35 TaxID=3234192 RepID=UPI00345F22EA
MNLNIAYQFWQSAQRYPENTALVVGKEVYTYQELSTSVRMLAEQIKPHLTHGRVGVLATRSAEACIGLLATAWAGGTYVPLNQKLPQSKLESLFDYLNLDALIVDQAGQKLIEKYTFLNKPTLILAPSDAKGVFDAQISEISDSDTQRKQLPEPVKTGEEHLAYIEFTSGTTGKPKGVMVSNKAVRSYFDAMDEWYLVAPEARVAETCDITFDLSVHNMFFAWRSAAGLYIMRSLDMVMPTKFVQKHKITTWLSVPSVVAISRQSDDLKDNSMPSLELSLFCGEALSVEIANCWMRAAPNSIVDNIYGPTEATIACLRQTWNRDGATTPARQIVAIGKTYKGMRAMIVDDNLNPVADGVAGEIVLCGEQLAEGYFQQAELTSERFPLISGERWYLTGDLGLRDENQIFHHLGRIDNQIKLHGYRIELEEIEMWLKDVAQTELSAAVAWPTVNGVAKGIVGFCVGSAISSNDIISQLNDKLPRYMQPSKVIEIESMPLNSNGKTDRHALVAMLDDIAINDTPNQSRVVR